MLDMSQSGQNTIDHVVMIIDGLLQDNDSTRIDNPQVQLSSGSKA